MEYLEMRIPKKMNFRIEKSNPAMESSKKLEKNRRRGERK